LTSVTDPNNRTVTYQYDAASNRTRLEYPDGSYALYSYDELGRMTTVQYDPNDSSTAPAPTTIAAYTYDNLSRRTGATLGNGTSAALSYSTNGLLSGITHTAPGGNVNFTYGHDASGLINNLSVSDDMFAPYTDIGGYKSFTPNNLNQYTSAMGQSITYDLNGNMAGNGTNAYVHDAANRLTAATVGSSTWTYGYGPLNRRVSKMDGTTTTQYLYDNDRAVAEYNSYGILLRKFVYGPGLDEPIIMTLPQVYHFKSKTTNLSIG
jgi:YD repeat-containing protein